MQVKCEYCENYIDDVAEQCSFCGAPNLNKVRAANAIPRTIAELQAFCAARNLDLERMHFHIGEDYPGPKAFGIYERGGRFVVYKNKSDGSRAVRYDGTDEAYAVNEIYQKMKAEIAEVQAAVTAKGGSRGGSGAGSGGKGKRGGIFGKKSIKERIGTVIALLAICSPFLAGAVFGIADLIDPAPQRGYYEYGGGTYYYGYDGWYSYDDGIEEWVMGGEPELFGDDPSAFWQSSDYNDAYGAPSFSTSDYWDTDNNWDDDWDDDDWDWGSSGGDDWDSGWDDWGSSGNDWDSDW